MSYDGLAEITTEPNKWPGVTSLRALLDRDKDEEMPNLIVLLSEAFVAIYMSLLSYALATCDAHILYRLVGQNVANSLWSVVFGGKIYLKLKPKVDIIALGTIIEDEF